MAIDFETLFVYLLRTVPMAKAMPCGKGMACGESHPYRGAIF
ncbi:hypothetical protein ACFL6I_07445 [candidate division KSB1 bacterium]